MDPGTINSDDEIEYFDDSDNEMEEKIYTKKERQQTRLVLMILINICSRFFSAPWKVSPSHRS